MRCAASCGQWPRDTIANLCSLDESFDRNCQRCSMQVPETLAHKCIQCPTNHDVREFAAWSEWVEVATAAVEQDQEACLWLRRLIPREPTRSLIPVPPERSDIQRLE